MGLLLFAANEGYLKDIEVKKVLDFEAALLAYAHSEIGDLMKQIVATGDWNGEFEAKFKATIDKFKATQTW